MQSYPMIWWSIDICSLQKYPQTSYLQRLQPSSYLMYVPCRMRAIFLFKANTRTICVIFIAMQFRAMAKKEMHFLFFVSIVVDKNYGAHSAFLKCSLSAANYKGLMSSRSVLQHLHCVHKTILVLFFLFYRTKDI